MKFEALHGKSWHELKAFMADSAHALVFDEPEGVEIAKTVLDYGAEAGAGVTCALLFHRANPPHITALAAIEIYQELLPDNQRVRELRSWMSWISGRPPRREDVWPVKPGFCERSKRARLANVMLFLAARSLLKGGMCETLVADAIIRFLRSGLEKKGQMTRENRNEDGCDSVEIRPDAQD